MAYNPGLSVALNMFEASKQHNPAKYFRTLDHDNNWIHMQKEICILFLYSH